MGYEARIIGGPTAIFATDKFRVDFWVALLEQQRNIVSLCIFPGNIACAAFALG